MTKLKPCAHCGAKAMIIRIVVGLVTLHYEYRIVCTGKHCSVRTSEYLTKEKAAMTWNRRSKPETKAKKK